jgi:hypothetical protein
MLSWTFLTAYSKAKLEISGDRVSPCFRPFWIRKLSDKCLPILTLPYVSFKHILSNLTRFLGTVYSIRILYKTSLLTESEAFLKSLNSWCTVPLNSHFFSSIWRMQKSWSVVDLLRRNPHWWSPIISSMWGPNLEWRILDKFCVKLIAVMSHDNYYSQFYHPFCELVQ